MTPLGQLPLFDPFVANCPKKRHVLGKAMLAMLAGAKRYAHIAALRREYLHHDEH